MGQLPGQHAPALPRNDRHQIQAPPGQVDLGDIPAPGLIGADNRHRAQQSQIDLVALAVSSGCARARREVSGLQSQSRSGRWTRLRLTCRPKRRRWTVIRPIVGPVAAANRASRLQELALPLTALIGVHTVLASQFVECLQAPCRFQSQSELERGTTVIAFLGRRFAPPPAELVIVPFHLNYWIYFPYQLSSIMCARCRRLRRSAKRGPYYKDQTSRPLYFNLRRIRLVDPLLRHRLSNDGDGRLCVARHRSQLYR
jgi:hypothetical protein